jgi:membrane fusion protein
MSHDLFRQEAIHHQSARWTGKALLLSALPARYVVLISVTFLIIFIGLLSFTTYTRRMMVSAEVITEPQTIQLFAPQQGTITKQFFQNGVFVRKGEALYELDASRVTRSGNVSAITVNAINDQLAGINTILEKLEADKTSTLQHLAKQLSQYQETHAAASQQLDSVAKSLALVHKNMQSYERYRQEGIVTNEQLNNQRSLYYQQQSSFQSMSTLIGQQRLEITKLRSEITTKEIEFDNQLSQYKNQRSDLQRQLSEADATSALLINSPIDGRIAAMTVAVGQMANAGDLLAQLVPTTEDAYRMIIWIPNQSVPYVKVGDPINIRYDAFPFEKFGQFSGRIITLASLPATTQELAHYVNAPRDGAPYYKAIASLNQSTFSYQDKTLHLSPGITSQVTLFLEKRPLYQWMFAPFYDMRHSVSGAINE